MTISGYSKAVVFIVAVSCSIGGAQAAALQDEQEPTRGRLAQMSLEDLGKIEVTTVSKRPEEIWRAAAAVHVITQEDIRRSGATSIPEILRLAPGVEVSRIDSVKWSIGIRGFGSRLSRSVLVLIDGRPVYTPLFAGVYWEVQDTLLEDIERIEVIRGPGGTLWGANAFNGVINIITKNAKDTHGILVSAGGGNLDQGSVRFRIGGGNNKGFNFRAYGKGFVRGPQFHWGRSEFDNWGMGQGGFRADWKRGRDTLTLHGDLYKGFAGQQLAISSYSPPSIFNAEGNAELAGGNLLGRWRRTLRGGSDLQVQAYYDRTNRQDLNFSEVRNTADIEFTHHTRLLRGHDFVWGAGMRFSSGDSTEVVPTIVFTPGDFTDKLYSAFVQDEIQLVESRLWLTVGSKFLHNSYSGFEIQPSVRLLWAPGLQQSLWGSFTRAVRTPSRVDEDLQFTALLLPSLPAFLRLTGNPEFQSEKLHGYEVGYRRLVHPDFSVDITAFYNRYGDLQSVEAQTPFIEVVPPAFRVILPVLFENLLLGTTAGIEIAPRWTPASWWRLTGSYSFLNVDMKRSAASIDGSSAASLEGSSPRHRVVFQSFFDLPKGLEFDQTIRYVSALPARGVDSYATADVRFNWSPVQSLDFSIVGQNLLQPHHAEFSGNPGGLVGIKRCVYAKVTWRR